MQTRGRGRRAAGRLRWTDEREREEEEELGLESSEAGAALSCCGSDRRVD